LCCRVPGVHSHGGRRCPGQGLVLDTVRGRAGGTEEGAQEGVLNFRLRRRQCDVDTPSMLGASGWFLAGPLTTPTISAHRQCVTATENWIIAASPTARQTTKRRHCGGPFGWQDALELIARPLGTREPAEGGAVTTRLPGVYPSQAQHPDPHSRQPQRVQEATLQPACLPSSRMSQLQKKNVTQDGRSWHCTMSALWLRFLETRSRKPMPCFEILMLLEPPHGLTARSLASLAQGAILLSLGTG